MKCERTILKKIREKKKKVLKKGQGRNGGRKKKKIETRKKEKKMQRWNVEKDNREKTKMGMNFRKREKRAPIFWFLD